MELSKPEDGYTYLLDWKKYVRPETIVIIDSDQSAYQAAAANERRTIKVTNKETQEVLEFKTRTEFWGRKKLSLGGWLADQNLQREVNGLSLYTKDDFIVEDVRMKTASVEGVKDVNVNIVFEPAWDKDMMSEEAKLELGFL